MRKFNAENERMKRRYFGYLKDAKGRDQKSIDKVVSALVKFEECTKYKSFKKFHIEQARAFKDALARAKNVSNGKPLSMTTIDATLRLVKGFFHWLAGQQGYKSVLGYADVEYFNNNAKDARAAHAQRNIPFPSMQAALHAFQAMPEQTELQHRDKAIFAFLMLTIARVEATASFKLKHVNLIDGSVFQDGREVKTKNSKTFTTTFYPVDKSYLDCFTRWVNYLRNEKLFGPEDALFPKPKQELIDGKFVFSKISREPYANGNKINSIVRQAFANVQLQEYTPHSFRKTLGLLLSDLQLPLETQKAWTQNMGHENMGTLVASYLPVSEQKQAELIKSLKV